LWPRPDGCEERYAANIANIGKQLTAALNFAEVVGQLKARGVWELHPRRAEEVGTTHQAGEHQRMTGSQRRKEKSPPSAAIFFR
jgi:hypothetical protein